MNKQKTLIFFGAHPDDETFGIGSTLARYAAAGVKVYCVCSTRGEAGRVDHKYMQGYATIGDLRSAEMKCAAQVLGLTDVIYLGYRDSGMMGSPDNRHPQALAMAPIEDVARRIVKIIRELKPVLLLS
jgi:N-acetyl-1-D-myo-inositol-2-amino-2-deoxy-alpha-D-glucopyranoside deacetylase